MEDNVEINVYSTNKQSTEQICQKCIDYLMEDKNRAVKLIARSNAIPKLISISEMVKSKLPHIIQINNLLNLDVSLFIITKILNIC
ncbi:hypothetical protein RS030_2249 [Cryptosporidium xiaoi]|uniref:DNA/RNA-binding protein Alba-like domain-containing protein n=1 Tax=Cryptosporidium xiaoi TaxID=659607 RepID=A0AAV9XW80_9CRYT